MTELNEFQKRVAARVEALGQSPITIATNAGLKREFIRDILENKKKSVRVDVMPILARVLQCSVGYLSGEEDEPGYFYEEGNSAPAVSGPAIPFYGVCETGVWRLQTGDGQKGARRLLPIAPDERFPGLPNMAFEVRGDGFNAEGIFDGMIVTAIPLGSWEEKFGLIRSGMAVVVEASRALPQNEDHQLHREVELSVRMPMVSLKEIRLLARPAEPIVGRFPVLNAGSEGVQILAVVTRAMRLFADIEAGLLP